MESDLRGMYDDRYGHPGLFDLLRCLSCGHRITFPTFQDADLPALYSTYYPRAQVNPDELPGLAVDALQPEVRWRLWWYGQDNQGHLHARPGMRVLDYGCGSGVSLLEIRKLGAEAFGIETDANVEAAAKAHGLQIHIGPLAEGPFPGVQFDLVSLNQVIEHIPDPASLLADLGDRLASAGKIALAFPNAGSFYRHLSGRRWINWHIPYHLHHFTRRSFRRFVINSGWRIVSLRTVTPTVWTMLQMRSRILPKRGVPNPLWLPHGEGSEPHAGWLRFSYDWLAVPLLSAWNRTVDWVGAGDSFVAIIEPAERAR